jgi:hypothetical protein
VNQLGGIEARAVIENDNAHLVLPVVGLRENYYDHKK